MRLIKHNSRLRAGRVWENWVNQGQIRRIKRDAQFYNLTDDRGIKVRRAIGRPTVQVAVRRKEEGHFGSRYQANSEEKRQHCNDGPTKDTNPLAETKGEKAGKVSDLCGADYH